MTRLILAAIVGLITVIAGALVGQVTDPALATFVGVLAGLAGTAAIMLGGQSAIDQLVALIPRPIRDEIVLYGGVLVTLVTSTQFAVLALPLWLHALIGVLVVLAGLLGIRSQAIAVSGIGFAAGGVIPSAGGQNHTTIGGASVTSSTPATRPRRRAR